MDTLNQVPNDVNNLNSNVKVVRQIGKNSIPGCSHRKQKRDTTNISLLQSSNRTMHCTIQVRPPSSCVQK